MQVPSSPGLPRILHPWLDQDFSGRHDRACETPDSLAYPDSAATSGMPADWERGGRNKAAGRSNIGCHFMTDEKVIFDIVEIGALKSKK